VTTHDVTTEVLVTSAGASGRGRTTLLRLSWREADPLAVTLLITPHPDHPSLPRGRWVVLRDFLRYGLEEPTGDGDVRIRPDTRAGLVHLTLARDGPPCRVNILHSVLRQFLTATEVVVPTGEEASSAAIDALLERLLRR
jgi:hypothetical protein